MARARNVEVILHKGKLECYNAPVMAAMEIVHQLNRSNCRVEDMKALRDLCRERYNKMLKGEDQKRRRRKKGGPVSERGRQLFAARTFSRKNGVMMKEALEIIQECWPEQPVFVAADQMT
jgi:hypothetical protein